VIEKPVLSESMQMYLATIARLWEEGRPVPLSRLARALSIGAPSVHEMCRKLQDLGLVIYRPYQGAMLSPEGQVQAYHVLRRHRLWEVFLVDKLGFEYDEAHEAACQLEHSTPERVANALDVFLDHPSVDPRGKVIPRANGALPETVELRLSELTVGQPAHTVRTDLADAARTFMYEQGLRPGAPLTVLAASESQLLVEVAGALVSIARQLAEDIWMEPSEAASNDAPAVAVPRPDRAKGEDEGESQAEAQTRQKPLDELSVGQRGVVVHVGGTSRIRHRMMDMGLVPGAEVKVLRLAPLGDPIEFEVRGYSLSLRRSEASQVLIELPEEQQ